MKAWDEIAGDFQQGKRESKDGEYCLITLNGSRVVCYRPGLRLIDFYRTSTVLMKDIPVRGAEAIASGHQETVARTDGATPSTGATT